MRLACRPVEERFRRRALSGKVCAACEIEKPRDQYSNTQWEKGTASKCIACCSTPQANNAKVWVRNCVQCSQPLPKESFSKTQWGSSRPKCEKCCTKNLNQRKQDFADASAAGQQQPESSLWPAGTTAEVAARWILEAPMTDLPSESLKTKQALLAKQGNPKWSSVAMGRQQSTVDAKKKLSFLEAAHRDLEHQGARDGIVSALQSSGVAWPNCKLDAQFFCREMPGMRMFLPVALSNQNSPISHICGSIHIPCIYMKKNPASIHNYMFWFGAG